MLREQASLINQAHKLLDIGLTTAAFVGSYFVKKSVLPVPWGGLSTGPNYYIVLLQVMIIWYLVFNAFGLYRPFRRQAYGQIFVGILKVVSVSMLILLLLLYTFKMTDVSRLMLGLFFLFDILLLALSKGLVFRLLVHYRSKGYNFRNLLVVGSRERAKDVLQTIGDRLDAGYRVIGCLENDAQLVGKRVKNEIQVIGAMKDLKSVLGREVVDELIFAMPLGQIPEVKRYIELAEEMGCGGAHCARLALKGPGKAGRPDQHPFRRFSGHRDIEPG